MKASEQDSFLVSAFRSLLKETQDMIFLKDNNLVYIAASDSFAKDIGYESGDFLVGKTDFDIFPKELAKKYIHDDNKILKSMKNLSNYIEPLPDQKGQKRYASTSKFIILDEDGKRMGLCGVARNVTAEVELREERESNRLSRQMFDDVIEADLTNDHLLRADGCKWSNTLALDTDKSFTQATEIIACQLVHEDYRTEFLKLYDKEKLLKDYKANKKEFSHVSYVRVPEKEEQYSFVKWSSRIYFSRVTNTIRLTTFLKNIDEEVRVKNQLQKEAQIDSLTGIYNRAGLFQKITENMSKEEEQGTNALLFIDLDCFKLANDKWGHLFGDGVLRDTARKLQEIFRESDVVGRLGGDEFLVFMQGISSKEQIANKTKNVLEALTFKYSKNGEELRVTCSIGIAMCKNRKISAEELCERADAAMYRAKESGRNQVFFYEEE